MKKPTLNSATSLSGVFHHVRLWAGLLALAGLVSGCGGGSSGGGGIGGVPSNAPALTPQYAYAIGFADNTLVQYTQGSTGELTTQSPAKVGTRQNPAIVVAHPNGLNIYVVNGLGNSVSQYAIGPTGSLNPVGSAPTSTGRNPVYMAITPNGKFAYVTNANDNTISEYSIGPDGALAALPVGAIGSGHGPVSVSIDPSGTHAYVTNFADASISQFSIGPDGQLALLGAAAVTTGQGPKFAAVDPAGKYVYVANNGDNTIWQYAIQMDGSLTKSQQLPSGMTPTGMVFDPSGQFLYVCNQAEATISQYFVGASGSVTPMSPAKVTTGLDPFRIRIDVTGKFIYTANTRDNTVSQFAVGATGALTALSAGPADGPSQVRDLVLVPGKPATQGAPAGASGTPVLVPTPVDLFTTRNRVVMPVTHVGSLGSLSGAPLLLGFDTGSAGVTLDARAVLPGSMVSESGFVFNGQSTLQYGGITVTTLAATKTFGLASKPELVTIFKGNLAFATLTFGAKGEIQSRTMPIFLYYSVKDGNGLDKTKNQDFLGIFGVNGSADSIAVTQTGQQSPDPAPAALTICNSQSKTTCHLVSAMRYVNYGPGVNAGFLLNPISIVPGCTASQGGLFGSCTNAAPYLTVGLNRAIKSGFDTVPLTCPGRAQPQGTTTDGISACQPEIQAATIDVSNPTASDYLGAAFSQTVSADVGAPNTKQMVIFDTGSVSWLINVPKANMYEASINPNGIPSSVADPQGSTVLGNHISIHLPTTPSFVYSYENGARGGLTDTLFMPNLVQRDVVGFDFFAHHSFFIDLMTNVEGFK